MGDAEEKVEGDASDEEGDEEPQETPEEKQIRYNLACKVLLPLSWHPCPLVNCFAGGERPLSTQMRMSTDSGFRLENVIATTTVMLVTPTWAATTTTKMKQRL